MEQKKEEWIIATSNGRVIWSFSRSKEDAEASLLAVKRTHWEEAKQFIDNHIEYGYNDRDPDYWLNRAVRNLTEQWEVMTFEDFTKRQADRILKEPIKQITRAEFEEALNVLPPMNWGCRDGFASFFMSEFLTGSYTAQYAQNGDRYYRKTVDYHRPETWIKQDMVVNLKEEVSL